MKILFECFDFELALQFVFVILYNSKPIQLYFLRIKVVILNVVIFFKSLYCILNLLDQNVYYKNYEL